MELETETNRLMYIVSNLLNRMKMMHCSIIICVCKCSMFLTYIVIHFFLQKVQWRDCHKVIGIGGNRCVCVYQTKLSIFRSCRQLKVEKVGLKGLIIVVNQ